MSPIRHRPSWLSILALLLLVFGQPGQATPQVVVSIKPVHALLSALMQGVAEPRLLLPDGVPPWRYEADADALAAIERADLLLWVGPELETALGRQLRGHPPRGRVLELLASDALKILPGRGPAQARDPWFWLDTRNMLILTDELTRLLAAMDPGRAHVYLRNRLALLPDLSRLDSEMENLYKNISGHPVLLYHDTQQYFEQAYALKVAASAMTPGDGAPSAADLLQLRGLLDRRPASCLFVEAGMPTPNLDLLQAGLTVRVIPLGSLGQGLAPGPDLYEKVIRRNFEAFRVCASRPQAEAGAAGSNAELPGHRLETRYLLQDHNGNPVTNLDFPQQYQLIYFGYTFCPDVCPTSLTVVAEAMAQLGATGERIQPLFVTVDPNRDTPELLRTYTAYFHPRLLGLWGSEEMVARVAAGFHVRYEKVISDSDPSRYSMDHTASLFLLGPDGRFRAKFAHGITPDDLAQRLRQIIADDA